MEHHKPSKNHFPVHLVPGGSSCIHDLLSFASAFDERILCLTLILLWKPLCLGKSSSLLLKGVYYEDNKCDGEIFLVRCSISLSFIFKVVVQIHHDAVIVGPMGEFNVSQNA